MGDIPAFVAVNWDTIVGRTIEHIALVGVAVGLAILTGVSIGIAITHNGRAANTVLYLAAIMITIPSLALFRLMNDASAPVTKALV